MDIRKVHVSQLNPAPHNPRLDLKPGDPAYEKIKKSIQKYGLVDPLVWNCRTGNVVGGHQRLKILIELGYQEVEVSVVDLPLEHEKLLNLSLNKNQGEWDEDKLAHLFEDISTISDLDLSLSGFDLPEIGELLDRLTGARAEDDFNVEAAVAAIDTPITQPGDLIQLGSHRLLCGDSAKPEDLKRLMRGEQAQLFFTDPPYNVAYYGGNRPHAKARPKPSKHWERIYADNMSQPEYEIWLAGILTSAAAFLAPGACCYLWNGHKQFHAMYQILSGLGFHISCVITWAKPNFAIGYGDYNQQTEFCLYGWKEDAPHRWYGPTNETTLWESKRDPANRLCHPTQKPIALAQRAIRNSTLRDEVVLDLFAGSGSTLISAESVGRRCYCAEIDARYCDAIVRRFIAFVGKDKVSEEIRHRYVKEASNV